MTASRWCLAVVAVTVSVTAGAADSDHGFPERFDAFVRSTGTLLASRPEGGVVVFDQDRGMFASWDARGGLTGICSLDHLGFAAAGANVIAVAGDQVMLPSFAGGGVAADGVQAHLVNLRACELEGVVSLPQPVMKLARARDYWVAETLPSELGEESADGWPGCDVLVVDDEGRLRGTLEVPKGLTDRWKQEGGSMGGSSFGRLVLTRGTHWLIPADRYELWRPRQHGRGEFVLEVPECLASRRRVFTGSEAMDQLRERFSSAGSDEVEELLARAGRSDSIAVHIPAVAGAASYGYLAAIAVRTTGDSAPGCRIDVWDLGLEQLVFTRLLDGVSCNTHGFLAMGKDVVWTLDGDAVLRLELPQVLEPLADPCAQISPDP